MATLPNYTNCPSCGRTIPLVQPSQELFQACICGEWMHYEPPGNSPAGKEPTKVVDNIQPIRPEPRTTRIDPPQGAAKGVTRPFPQKETGAYVAPRKTGFHDQAPPVQPSTKIHPEQPVPNPVASSPRQTNFQDQAPPVQPPTHLEREEPATSPEGNLVFHPVTDPSLDLSPARPSRKGLFISILLFVVMALFLLAGWLYLDLTKANEEKTLRGLAEGEFKSRNYLLAKEKFTSLQQQFPQSQWEKEYRYWEQLSRIKQGAESPGGGLPKAAKELSSLSLVDKSLGTNCLKEAGIFAVELLDKGPKEESYLKEVEATVKKLAALLGEENGQVKSARGKLGQLRLQLAAEKKQLEEKNLFLKTLREFDRLEPARVYSARKDWVDRAKGSHPDLVNLPETQQLLNLAIRAHLRSINYESGAGNLGEKISRQGLGGVSSFIQIPEKRQPDWLPDSSFPLAANIRSTLFGFHPASGKVLWVKRLGKEVTFPPVPHPPLPDNPALILSLCENGAALCALDSYGQPAWQASLGGTCLAGFLVWNQVALIPCVEGHLLEVELAQGKILGRWQLGQNLLQQGVLDEKEGILYQPADPGTLLLLDLKEKKCFNLIYTGHALGNLASPPLLAELNPGARNSNSHLFLIGRDLEQNTTATLFPIPRPGPLVDTLSQASWKFPGAVSGPLLTSRNRMVFLNSQGMLNLLAWKTAPKWEESLVPILQSKDPLPLSELIREPFASVSPGAMVAIGYQDLWVAYRGHLRQLQMLMDSDGLRLAPGQPNPLEIGAPLNAGFPFTGPRLPQGGLLLPGQLSDRSCRVAAFDLGKNRGLWHHRLNGVFRSAAVKIPSSPGDYLATDEAGAVYHLAQEKDLASAKSPWVSGGKIAAPPIGFPLQSPPLLFPLNGNAVLQFMHLENTGEVILRRLRWKDSAVEVEAEASAGLDYHLAAPPVLIGEDLLLAKNQGIFVRVGLHDGKAQIRPGPPWKNPADASQGMAAPAILDQETFAFCNPAGEVELYTWPQSRQELFRKINLTGKGIPLASRVDAVNTPLGSRLLFWKATGELGGFSKNSEGQWVQSFQHTFEAPEGGLTHWVLKNGASQDRVAILSKGRELSWLDPATGKILWKHKLEEELAFPPAAAGNQVWAVFYNKRPRGWEEGTGKALPAREGFPPNVFPSAAPWTLDNNRVAFPLEDGSVFHPLP
ncbi:MAG: hypothetical protein EXR99_10865 [Gemmataceae bacterium]|nr:hypothetical protein [Gemmataceae bacterium]